MKDYILLLPLVALVWWIFVKAYYWRKEKKLRDLQCNHDWIDVKEYTNIIRKDNGISLGSQEWFHDERGYRYFNDKRPSSISPPYISRHMWYIPNWSVVTYHPAHGAVCVKCGECGGSILEAQDYIELQWIRNEEQSQRIALAKKIYADNCAGVMK